MYRAAIVGLGPAGLGPLVAAARAGALNKWLRDDVAIFENPGTYVHALPRRLDMSVELCVSGPSWPQSDVMR